MFGTMPAAGIPMASTAAPLLRTAQEAVLVRHALELAVDLGLISGSPVLELVERLEKRVQLASDQDVLVQRNGAALLDDRDGVSADLGEPGAELLDVGDRGLQRDDTDRLGQADDHLLPHGAAGAVSEIMNLVHDHEAEVEQSAGAGVEHVA